MPDPPTSNPPPIDARWIRETVDQYEGLLLRYAGRLLGDADRARDVVQEVFMRLCDQDRQTVEGHLAQWLYTVARNLSLNINRKEKRMTRLSATAVRLRPSTDPGPRQIVQQRDEEQRAIRLLDDLPEHQQEVIRLKFQHGLTYRQIAEITGHPVSTIGYLIHTGLDTIRNEMTPAAQPPSSDSATDAQQPTSSS